ncbi:MAG TPA: class F sortase [Frankiaceae bacterium]|nr:class F sortase [Frankiaceae bacterium]
MRISRRRVGPALRGRSGAAARAARPAPPAPGAVRADWRAVVARGAGVAPDPVAPARPAPSTPGRTVSTGAVALGLGVALLGQAGALIVVRPAPATAAAAPAVVGPAQRVTQARPPARRAAVPVGITISRIGVSTTLLPLGLLPDGTLDTPSDFDRAGWYTRGARPGERGPAVVVGHVDSRTGPAVFFRLRELRRGDVISVRRADRTQVRYVVRTVRSVPKTKFPTKAVYGATRRPTLRLVTCGGTFDPRARSYRDNVVVFADLAPARAS